MADFANKLTTNHSGFGTVANILNVNCILTMVWYVTTLYELKDQTLGMLITEVKIC